MPQPMWTHAEIAEALRSERDGAVSIDHVGLLLLKVQRETARRCARIIVASFYQRFAPDTDVDTAWRGCEEAIRKEFGL